MENLHIPGDYTTSQFNTAAPSMATPSSNQYSDSLKSREGKFDNLSVFLSADAETIKQLKQYKHVGQAQIRPGSIIYVHDLDVANTSGSRLHNRILLVKTMNPASMICFTFCRHAPQLRYAEDAQSHWCVIKAGANPPDSRKNPAKLEPLEIELYLDSAPQENITVNVRDPWNVENEVLVAKLGEVSAASWRKCRKRINEIFAGDESDEDLEGTGARDAKNRAKSDAGVVESAARPQDKRRGGWVRPRVRQGHT